MKLPYARHWIDDDDIRAVVAALRSDWITSGPLIEAFEGALAGFVGAKAAVAVSNGTAALHAAMYAAGIGKGDEVIVPPMTFVATANAVVFQGGLPVFADVDSSTLLVDPAKAEAKVNDRTKAIVAVDYAGQPCDYDALRDLADRNDLILIADSCHALGAEFKGSKVGTLADLTAFSFHPAKHITTGEGGALVTENSTFADKARRFRNHGITTDHRQRSARDTWYYEMRDLGYNYRITDIQSALGLSQLAKLPKWLARRREIAEHYGDAFEENWAVEPLAVSPDVLHAYHLYVIRLKLGRLTADRAAVFSFLRREGIGVNVHYIPVHLQPFYQSRFGTREGDCPVAEAAYREILSLPMFPAMSDADVEGVTAALKRGWDAFRR